MNFSDVYEILNHMKLTFTVNNERQLQMYIEDKYNKSNSSSNKVGFNKLKKDGKQVLQDSMKDQQNLK